MRVNFNWWCHKVLPLVYDDSLSYYEVISRVCDYITGMLDDVKVLVENYSELVSDVAQLRSEVKANKETLDVCVSSLESAVLALNQISVRVGTLANQVNELEGKVPFAFGVDDNGNYGYIKDGADTVTPFKTSVGGVIAGKLGSSNLTGVVFNVIPCWEVV